MMKGELQKGLSSLDGNLTVTEKHLSFTAAYINGSLHQHDNKLVAAVGSHDKCTSNTLCTKKNIYLFSSGK